jgi:hypothetical protein
MVLAALLGLSAPVLAGCSDGGSERGRLLGPQRAAELRASLDGVEQKADAGDCDGAAAQADALREQVSALPESIDSNLRDTLASGTDRLHNLVERRCTPAPAASAAEPPPAPEEQPADEDGGSKKDGGEEKKEESGAGGENPGKGEGKGLEKTQPQEDQSSGGVPDTGGVTP